MSQDVLRLSQVVGMFGPGAMADLPDRSVIVTGLDDWEMSAKGAFRLIEERRLTQFLQQRLQGDPRIAQGRPLSLRTPPLDPHTGPRGFVPGVLVNVFPAWFTCNAVETAATAAADGSTAGAGPRRRRMVEWLTLDPEQRKRYQDDAGKSHDVTPLRFVCGCQNGHLQDVPWRWVVHGGTPCTKPLWLEESGTSGDARDLRVVCGCGRSLFLPELYQSGRLGRCEGARPWIGDRDPSGCTDDFGKPVMLRLLSRNATHAYYPQIARVISLPEADDAIGRLVAAHLSDLQEAKSPADIGQARKFNQAVRAALEGISDEAVFARLRQLLVSGGSGGQEPNPRIAEYELLASGAERRQRRPRAQPAHRGIRVVGERCRTNRRGCRGRETARPDSAPSRMGPRSCTTAARHCLVGRGAPAPGGRLPLRVHTVREFTADDRWRAGGRGARRPRRAAWRRAGLVARD